MLRSCIAGKRIRDRSRCVGLKVTPPKLSNKRRVEPEYSEEARREHVSGLVRLSVVVDVDGRVRNITIIRGLGYGLDENAAKAVRTWEFTPAMKDGVPVEATVPVECTFRTLSK